MDSLEILKEYFKLNDEIVPKFCETIHDSLSAKHFGDYLSKLTSRMKDELDLMIDSNNGLYDELYSEAYIEMSNTMEKKDISRIEETNNIVFNLTTDWYNSIVKFLDITKGDSRSIVSIKDRD